MGSGLRIIFFGLGGHYAIVPLRAILAEHEVVAVYSDQRPIPRQQRQATFSRSIAVARLFALGLGRRALGVQPSLSLATVARMAGTPFRQVTNLNAPEVIAELRAHRPDLICISSLNRILKPDVLEVPTIGVINAHNALLPDFRGPNPFFWMVKLGALRGGCTLHWAEREVDGGPILGRRPVQIYPGMTALEYADSLAFQIAELYRDILADIAAGVVPQGEQNAVPTTPYCRNPKHEDLALDPSYTCAHAQWFHQIASTYGEPFVTANANLVSCRRLARIPFNGGIKLEFADGPLWAAP